MTQRDIMFRCFQMHKFISESMVPTVAMTVNINATQLTELKSKFNKINGHGKFMSFLKQMSMDQSHSSTNSPIEFLRQYYGNFVISNFGSLNIDSGSLALSQPMIAGLCIGGITSISLIFQYD